MVVFSGTISSLIGAIKGSEAVGIRDLGGLHSESESCNQNWPQFPIDVYTHPHATHELC